MTFFNSISPERKLQIVEGRINSLKEQLWILMIDAGLIPENLDINTFDSNTSFPENNIHLKSQYDILVESINKMEEIKLGLQN